MALVDSAVASLLMMFAATGILLWHAVNGVRRLYDLAAGASRRPGSETSALDSAAAWASNELRGAPTSARGWYPSCRLESPGMTNSAASP